MDLRIRQFECFLALAETLHFGKTAQRLHISQPALTFQIQAMEAAIGMQLFSRDRRRVQLTDAGRNLVVTGNRILSELRAFQEKIAVYAMEQPLRVVCAPAGEQVILPGVIRRLKELAPQSRIALVTLPPIEHATALLEHEVDVLLMVRKIEVHGITFQPITTQRMYALVPEGSRFARRGRITAREFAGYPIIVPSREYCDKTQQLIENLFAPFGVHPRFIEAPGRQSVHEAMVAAGMGLTLNTEWRLLAPFPGVTMVPFDEKIPPLQLGAAWRSTSESSVLNTFKTALSDVLFELGDGKNRRFPVVKAAPLSEIALAS